MDIDGALQKLDEERAELLKRQAELGKENDSILTRLIEIQGAKKALSDLKA